MKKILKRITLLLVALCIMLTGVFATACNDNPDDSGDNPVPPVVDDKGDPAKDGYVIKVVYPDGSIVKGSDCDNPSIPVAQRRVRVRLLDQDGVAIPSTAAAATVNESGNGVITYNVPGVYTVELQNAPLGYDYDKITTTADRAYYTIQLKLGAPTAYTVNVKYENGDPAQGVNVALTNGNSEVSTMTTDSDGKAVTQTAIERGTYNVVVDAPAGYIYPATKTAISALPVTIILKEVIDVTFADDDKLDEAGTEIWDDAFNSKDFEKPRLNLEGDNYVYNVDLYEEQEIFFTVTAPQTGSYTIASKSSDYVIKFYSNDLTSFDGSLTIDSTTNNGKNIQEMRIVEGETLTFSCTTKSGNAGAVEILVGLPVPAPETQTATEAGSYTLTYLNHNTAILSFKPKTSGIYTITSNTDQYDVMMVQYANGNPIPTDNPTDLPAEYQGIAGDDNSGIGNNFKHTETVTKSYVGNTYLYYVIIKDENLTFPIQIGVTITRDGDAPAEIVVERKKATTNVSTPYANQSGTFTWMPADGSVEVVKEDGLYYAIISGVKKPLVVAITMNLDGQEYSFSDVEYKGEPASSDLSGEVSDGRVNNYLTVYEDINTRLATVNYTEFIEQYVNYVNRDGVYEVNEELHTFLVRYMDQHFHHLTQSTVKPAEAWLLGCGYYA